MSNTLYDINSIRENTRQYIRDNREQLIESYLNLQKIHSARFNTREHVRLSPDKLTFLRANIGGYLDTIVDWQSAQPKVPEDYRFQLVGQLSRGVYAPWENPEIPQELRKKVDLFCGIPEVGHLLSAKQIYENVFWHSDSFLQWSVKTHFKELAILVGVAAEAFVIFQTTGLFINISDEAAQELKQCNQLNPILRAVLYDDIFCKSLIGCPEEVLAIVRDPVPKAEDETHLFT